MFANQQNHGKTSEMDSQAFHLLMTAIDDLKSENAEIRASLNELLAWKWKLAGATLLLSAFGGVVVQYMIAKVGS